MNINVYDENTVSNTRICKSVFSKTGLVALRLSSAGNMKTTPVTTEVGSDKQVPLKYVFWDGLSTMVYFWRMVSKFLHVVSCELILISVVVVVVVVVIDKLPFLLN